MCCSQRYPEIMDALWKEPMDFHNIQKQKWICRLKAKPSKHVCKFQGCSGGVGGRVAKEWSWRTNPLSFIPRLFRTINTADRLLAISILLTAIAYGQCSYM